MPIKYSVIAIVAIGAASIGSLFYSQLLSTRIFERNANLVRLTETTQYEVATAHLWFEEALGGDATIDLQTDVHGRLMAMIGLINAQLNAADSQLELNGNSLAEVRHELSILAQRIAALDAMVDTRWRDRATTGAIGGVEDQEFDQLFHEILEASRTTGELVNSLVAADQQKVWAINAAMSLVLMAV